MKKMERSGMRGWIPGNAMNKRVVAFHTHVAEIELVEFLGMLFGAES